MKLFLLRHAKSDWGERGLADHDRPLAARGERAATLMGAHLAQRGISPSLVLCSSARRTRETLDRVLAQLPRTPEVRVERQLYLASRAELIDCIGSVEDEHRALLVIGHNPGMAELALHLSRGGDAEALGRMEQKFPTAGLAEIEFEDGSWTRAAAEGGELRSFRTPKDLV